MKKGVNLAIDSRYIQKADELKGIASRSAYMNDLIRIGFETKGIEIGEKAWADY